MLVGRDMTLETPCTRRIGLLLFIVLLFLATALRFHKLEAQSFWNDEGNSARLSERSIELILEGTASDIHPPLYYLLLRSWRGLLGDSEFGLRAFSAFAGILTVAAVFPLSRLLSGKKKFEVLFFAVFLTAINPALIYYSQETRMYAMLALIAVLSSLVFFRWLTGTDNTVLWGVAFVVLSTAGLYTHYFYPVILIFQLLLFGLYLLRYFYILAFSPMQLVYRRPWRQSVLQLMGMISLIFLLYLPWLPIFIRQTSGREGIRAPLYTFLWDGLRWMAFGETFTTGDLVWPSFAAALLLSLGILIGPRKAIIPLIGLSVPVLAMFIIGSTDPAFHKFMLVSVPYFVLLASDSFHKSSPFQGFLGWVSSIIPILLLIVVLYGVFVSLNNYFNDPAYSKADYRQMAAQIAADQHPNAGIILNAPNQWEVFTYYHKDGAPVYPLPLGQPDPAILEPRLAEIGRKHERLYGIFWGDAQRDPQGVVEAWLDKNAFKTSEQWVGDVRFVIYALPQGGPSEMETALGLRFGEVIELEGYTLGEQDLKPGDVLPVTLFWRTAEPLEKRYKVFIHLVGEDGRLVSQRDDEPGGGQLPTVSWQPGDRIQDNHGLLIPVDLPPGEYRLLVGLYDLADPSSRLFLSDGDKSLDAMSLGSVIVIE